MTNPIHSSNPLPADEKRFSGVRGAHKGAFTKLEKKVDDFPTTVIATPNQLVEAEALLKTLQDKIQVIHRYDAEIELLLDYDDQVSQDMELSTQFHHNASVTVARLSALIDNYKRQSEVTVNSPPYIYKRWEPENSSKLKLPKLQLPSFTGSYTDWMSFADLFKASVDSNNQLSNSEKLNCLKACVKREAAKLISSVTITDQNYEIAWELLHERYENKRSLVQAHLQAIWSQGSLKSESSTGLRKLLETTNENLRALTELGQPVEYWNAIFVHSLSEKMDPESRKQWQLDHSGTDLLTWKQLAKFLDTRSRALEIGGSKPSGQVNATQNAQRPDKRNQSFSISSLSCEMRKLQ